MKIGKLLLITVRLRDSKDSVNQNKNKKMNKNSSRKHKKNMNSSKKLINRYESKNDRYVLI